MSRNGSPETVRKQPTREQLDQLIEHAVQLGATGVALIRAEDIVVEDALAAICRETRCENFGQSMSCPPHVEGPSAFRRWRRAVDHALVIKIEVPLEFLLSADRTEIMRLLHLVVSGVERSAHAMGFTAAQGFAGDSCKKLFCHDHPECRVLNEGGPCRNPQCARPSMSGFGINVSKLMESAGWQLKKVADGHATGTVTGLVLLG